MTEFEIAIAVWNIFVFIIYGADKLCARLHKRRIRERTLISLAYLIAGVGAMFGMVVFNHKTSKMKFRILIPLSVVISRVEFMTVNKYWI